MTEDFSGVYAIIQLSTGRRYVGSSKRIKRRWQFHRSHLSKNVHHSRFLQRAWNKYGADDFKFTVLEVVKTNDLSEIFKREQVWLDKFRSYERKNGFNCYSYVLGPRNYTFSKETRQKLSMAFRGRKKSADHIEKIRLSNIGKKKRPRTPEEREKIGAQFRGKRLTGDRLIRAQSVLIERNKTILAKPHTINHNDAIARGLRQFYSDLDKSRTTRQAIGKHFRGKSLANGHRQRISRALKGRVFTDEHRQRISDAKRWRDSNRRSQDAVVIR